MTEKNLPSGAFIRRIALGAALAMVAGIGVAQQSPAPPAAPTVEPEAGGGPPLVWRLTEAQ
jgi:hypothetical protein